MIHLLIKQKMEYLEKTQKVVSKIKECSYALLDIQLGQKILEVGCGPGTDTVPLAKIVGPKGKVVGIDTDIAMIQKANHRSKAAHVDFWTNHVQANAASIPYDDDTFDVCRSERMFVHLHNPDEVLAEIIRVTKVGGYIGILDPDWGTLSIDSSMPSIERKLIQFKAESFINGYAGKKLYRQFRKQNLTDIHVEMFPITMTDYSLARYIADWDKLEKNAALQKIITIEELKIFNSEMQERDKKGQFFGSLSMIMVTGRKR